MITWGQVDAVLVAGPLGERGDQPADGRHRQHGLHPTRVSERAGSELARARRRSGERSWEAVGTGGSVSAWLLLYMLASTAGQGD